ncbi:type I restriction enzyme, S subunit [Salegentibacter agarivorans]|uniref:Type I restriction enzyme, S subunit n=1 Tax=Salegentibacter agarivorans TaxID=345907 RepID=A0A1I2Q8H3_9FLAO|nr:restriction endonuclease subunit S [Salegentibacter agarivorans]SFG22577.1 type I restriction enzyme, S subunit [Salegentibacter agarivorans]
MQIEKKLVPKLRFREFSNDWERVRLGKLVEIKSGISPSSYNFSEDGKYPFIKVEELNNCEKYQFQSRFYSNSSNNLIEFNSILFPKRGAAILNNKIRISSVPLLMDSNMMALKCDDSKLYYEFLYYKIIKEKLYRIADTSTIPQLNNKHIIPYNLFIPTLVEQQKIAKFLTAIDTRIHNLEKKKDLLEQYKRGVIQKIFKQELRFKNGDGKDFPEWKYLQLGKLTTKTGKKNKENINYPIYSINNKEGFLPQGEQFDGMDSNERGYDISLYKVIKKNTFAYNPARINVGSIGFSGKLDDIIVSSLYVCFKTKEALEDRYLKQYLNTFQFNKDVLRFSEGGVRQYLFFENFSKIKIPLPNRMEQLKIASFVETLDKKIALITQQIEQSKSYRKALLQQMFV